MFTYQFEGSLLHSDKELGDEDIEQLAPRLRQMQQRVGRGNRALSIRVFENGNMYAVEEPRYVGSFVHGGKFA